MSNNNPLDILEKNREKILLIEIAGLLHDIGKFCDIHIAHHCENRPCSWSNRHAYKSIVDDPKPIIESIGQKIIKKVIKNIILAKSPKISDYLTQELKEILKKTKVVVLKDKFSIAELIMLGFPSLAASYNSVSKAELGKNLWLPAMLGMAHSEAHFDKQSPENNQGKPTYPEVFLSTPFGFEFERVENLTNKLKNLELYKENKLLPRSQMIKNIEHAFIHGLGDTRRPINEVTLWDWSYLVASILKATISGAILTNKYIPINGYYRHFRLNHTIEWQVMWIFFDYLKYIEQAPTIGDVISKQKVIDSTLEAINRMLEEEYPIGNEIYRDENGCAYLLPNLQNHPEQNRIMSYIESSIKQKFAQETKHEIIPSIKWSKPNNEAIQLYEVLGSVVDPIHPDVDGIRKEWSDKVEDICVVCGLRPRGKSKECKANTAQKAKNRDICCICLQRRDRRSEKWAKSIKSNSSRTIWIDEVADNTGKAALIVGKIDNGGWLNGSFIKSTLIKASVNKDQYESKNPSFARIYRIWRTTKRFWEEVSTEIAEHELDKKHRIILCPKKIEEIIDKLGKFHVYDAIIKNHYFSVVWDSDNEYFIVADNIVNLANVIGAKTYNVRDSESARRYIIANLFDHFTLFEPGGYKKSRGKSIEIHIDQDKTKSKNQQEFTYRPFIPLLTEPSTFMMIVPAGKAISIMKKIKEKYELEMGKVQNRLPIFMGAIFFDRKQTLYSVLDTARRMIRQEYQYDKEYRVCKVTVNADASSLPTYLSGNPHFSKWVDLKIEIDNHETSYAIPLMMGDGHTEDIWYPYFQVTQLTNPSTKYCFELDSSSQVSSQNKEKWVKVDKLEKDNYVKFTVSKFAYIYLDTASRRFEIDGNKFLLLTEITMMDDLWNRLEKQAEIGKLTETKLQSIIQLLQHKKNEWGSSKTFQEFVKDVLKIEMLNDTITPDDVISGRLFNVFNLYHRILKKRLRS